MLTGYNYMRSIYREKKHKNDLRKGYNMFRNTGKRIKNMGKNYWYPKDLRVTSGFTAPTW